MVEILIPKSPVGKRLVEDWQAKCEFLGCYSPAELLVHDRRNKTPDLRMCGKHAHLVQQEFDWVTLWHLSFRQPGD